MTDVFPQSLESGLQVEADEYGCFPTGCQLHIKKNDPCHLPHYTWFLSLCCYSASSWLIWCPAVIAGLAHLQTWTSGRDYCVTAGPFMPDRVLLCGCSQTSAHLIVLSGLLYDWPLNDFGSCLTGSSTEPEASLEIFISFTVNKRNQLCTFVNKKKISTMPINSVLAEPLIPLNSWIIHSQLDWSGWSCLHGTSSFSVIHLLSNARDLLIVVYCLPSDCMLFLCHRDYSRQRSEYLGNSRLRSLESCSPVKHHECFTFKVKVQKKQEILPNLRCQEMRPLK